MFLGDVDDCLLGENTLKWIHCDHAGLNGSTRLEAFARGIPVTSLAERSVPVLVEHAIYFMMQSCYHTKELLEAQKKHQFVVEGADKWSGLSRKTADIIGLGNNGRLFADCLKAFSMHVIAYDRGNMKHPSVDEYYSSNNGDTLDPLLED